MAANAELRSRKQQISPDNTDKPRVDILKNLRGTEVVIDSVIYDLDGFDHPGGSSILIFGGNDVTVQYKMIHPFHTSKHLEKMRMVGQVKDAVKQYAFDTPFEREVKSEVFKIVGRGREYGTWGYFARAFFYMSLMAYLQYLWVTQGASWMLALVFGIVQASIGLNVQHDANHGAASKKPWVNDLLGLGADFIGGSKWLWMQQHWTHHAFTNHGELDPDAFSAEPMMLFHDYPLDHPARRSWHKIQAVLFLPILSFYWLSSVFNPQILDLQQRGAQSVGIKMDNDFTKSRRKYAVTIRLLYIYWNVVCPFRHTGFAWATFGQILFMGVSESITLAALFALSHNFEHSNRDPLKPTRETGEHMCWFKAQVETSSTYGGLISGALTGGLNFQIEHHLFPRMSSAWYPFIAPKVREVCAKHGVRYAYYPWVHQNFISTVRYMHQAGTGSNWMRPLEGGS